MHLMYYTGPDGKRVYTLKVCVRTQRHHRGEPARSCCCFTSAACKGLLRVLSITMAKDTAA